MSNQPEFLRHRQVGQTVYVFDMAVQVDPFGTGWIQDSQYSYLQQIPETALQVRLLGNGELECRLLPVQISKPPIRWFPYHETPGVTMLKIVRFIDINDTMTPYIPNKYRQVQSKRRRR